MSDRIYLTTTLPYVNADPHLGFALEIVQTDILARHHRLLGREVFFNTGADEHGLKIYRQALIANQEPQVYVDQFASRFRKLKTALNLSYDSFIRTTDKEHLAAVQEFWRRCAAAGDIYKKNYQIKYCVGCELEKTDSELADGRCPIHPTQTIEVIEEENYFFRFSKYQKKLLALYDGQLDFVVPATRLREIRAFVARGLDDFSISRLAAKMPWGVTVPDDPAHTIYVWFDALVNYLSAIGWPNDIERFARWWPPARTERGSARSGGPVQLAGKDNLRQQAAMWQVMLMSAGLAPSKQIVIHGFITSGGQKMSKSLGNVIDPFRLAEEYGTDAVRYFLARHVRPFEDTDVTVEKFKEAYNAHLANGLGNLVSRIMTLAATHLDPAMSRGTLDIKRVVLKSSKDYPWDCLVCYEFNQAADVVWRRIGELDATIQRDEPYKTVKTDLAKGRKQIAVLVQGLAEIAGWLTPFMPQTAAAIADLIRANRAPTQPLFPRK